MGNSLRKRIIAFYIAGIVNAFLGLYVIIEGVNFLEADKARMLAIFFFVFAAVDFYFPYAMQKKLRQDLARERQGGARQQGGPGAADSGRG